MGLNSFQLKCIAVITMLIDHFGAVFYPEVIVFRIIGRLSFPIFCYLMAEGFLHTADFRRYLIRIAIFALISEIPYDLVFHHRVLEFGGQNVFFTLALGVLSLYMAQRSKNRFEKIIVVVSVMCAAQLLNSDYGGAGIALIFLYYELRRKKWVKLGAGAVWNIILYGVGSIQNFGAFAAVPLAFYNGKRGLFIRMCGIENRLKAS